jgi:hypothetical protein
MRTDVRSLPRPMSPPLVSSMVIAVALIVAEALVVYLLGRVPPEICLRFRACGGWRWAWLPRDREWGW